MANNAVSDKRIVIGLLVGCVIAILIFHFAWWTHFIHNLSNYVFSIGYGILMGAFVVEGIGVYRCKDDDRKDWKRKVLLAISVALLAWLGGWAAGNNEKKMFQDDVNKSKETTKVYPDGLLMDSIDANSAMRMGSIADHKRIKKLIKRNNSKSANKWDCGGYPMVLVHNDGRYDYLDDDLHISYDSMPDSRFVRMVEDLFERDSIYAKTGGLELKKKYQ